MKVEIYDQRYNIRGDVDEAYVAELARYVDGKMRDISESTKNIDSLRVAVLAALNIADELHSLRKQHAGLEEELRERAERCVKLVEQVMKQSA